MQFEDPEDLYELSDTEINQMQAAGYINQDGFYDFVFPEDAADLQKERLSPQKLAAIAALSFVGVGVLTWIVLSFASVL